MTISLIIIVVIILAVVWLFWGGRNRLVRLNISVDESAAQISTQLQRRFDLIPNLVETVKGYAKHEQETFNKVTEARNAIGNALKNVGPEAVDEAEKQYQSARLAINAVAENYPDLKANQNFLALQEELTSTENKVSFARQAYNDSVRAFNIGIQVFPTSLIAGMFGFHKREMFEVENEAVKEAPKVQF
ncbi:LemA family protein [Lactovum miscens]|uniref:LemA protein n=1 Tax=Lactovum miscens TaxID=190387 RepID=A0A841C6X7_9LACT|nr:LemA family protein [Lactovum miscens]MBB5888094.1 LemA protein [Lactovum miscens]